MNAQDCTLYHGGLKGAETLFGENAEKYGVQEVVFTFEGHRLNREKNAVTLSEDDLLRGDISMELASRMMNRTYYETEKIRRVLQSIFHMVNKGHQVFVVGTILEDNSVKGGTGWAVRNLQKKDAQLEGPQDLLQHMAEAACTRYLALAHLGRVPAEQAQELGARWQAEVTGTVAAHWSELNTALRADPPTSDPLQPLLGSMLRGILQRSFVAEAP